MKTLEQSKEKFRKIVHLLDGESVSDIITYFSMYLSLLSFVHDDPKEMFNTWINAMKLGFNLSWDTMSVDDLSKIQEGMRELQKEAQGKGK